MAVTQAEIVDNASNQFFAGPGFTVDEDGGIRDGNGLHLEQDATQGRTLAHDLLEIGLIANVILDIEALLGKLLSGFTDLLIGQRILQRDANLSRNLREEINFVLAERIVVTTN